MEYSQSDIRQIDTQISSLEQQRVYLESELAQQQPNSMLYSTSGERILGSPDRLKVLETEFTQLAARYGAAHPDVLSMRRQLEALRAEVKNTDDGSELAIRLKDARAKFASVREKYSADHPDVKSMGRQVASLEAEFAKSNALSPPVPVNALPDNPAYIQLKARLEATTSDLRASRAQRASLSANVMALQLGQTKAPEVEREYRTLTRDYDVAQMKYQEVLAKRQEAELSNNLESEKQGERFTLIEPPVVPQKPSRPNRLAIGLLGSVLAIGGGIGSSTLAEALDQRVYGRAVVLRLLGVPPLAVIPNIDSTSAIRRRKRNWMLAFAGVLLALALLAVALHVFYKPLDVLFFVITRKLGL